MYAFFSRMLLPHAIFFAMLAAGYWLGELTVRRIAWFFGIWLAAVLILPLAPYGILWATAVVAVMDIVLILMIFKRDIRVD